MGAIMSFAKVERPGRLLDTSVYRLVYGIVGKGKYSTTGSVEGGNKTECCKTVLFFSNLQVV